MFFKVCSGKGISYKVGEHIGTEVLDEVVMGGCDGCVPLVGFPEVGDTLVDERGVRIHGFVPLSHMPMASIFQGDFLRKSPQKYR